MLKHLTQLQEGSYLLSHRVGEPTVQILQAIDKAPLAPTEPDSPSDSDDELVIVEEETEKTVAAVDPQPPAPSTCSYDLYRYHENSGETDTRRLPFLLTQWPSDSSRIPYTFPVAPEPKVKGKPKRKSSEMSKRVRTKKHCFLFLKGTCPKGSACEFPHLTSQQLEQSSGREEPKSLIGKRKRAASLIQGSSFRDLDAPS